MTTHKTGTQTTLQSVASLWIVARVAIAPPLSAAKIPPTAIAASPTAKQLLPRRKFYQGFEADPDYCDTRQIRGWFYWYVDTSGRCTIVIVANREEAIRQSRELFESSFSVVVAGFGIKNQ